MIENLKKLIYSSRQYSKYRCGVSEMVFDAIKKWINKGKYQETPNHRMEIINEELDEFEREIQEYIHYTEEHKPTPPANEQPEVLAQGGGRAASSLITPEEEKRIEGEEN
jgi:predicted RNA-binding protein with PIN domain